MNSRAVLESGSFLFFFFIFLFCGDGVNYYNSTGLRGYAEDGLDEFEVDGFIVDDEEEEEEGDRDKRTTKKKRKR